MPDIVVDFQEVSKSYPIYDAPGDRLKELITFNRLTRHRDFWALRDVSFSIRRGETFCIIGENGSGKSTLLQIVAGILQPSAGQASIRGRVAALLELGSGFNPEFTGRDNVYLNAAILGLSSAEIDRRYKDIEAFAEIGEFIHQPVKTYSSGMVVRLAFSVMIHVDPEILLVDEALAVGDIYFRQRCMRKVHDLRSRGVTILFVSHAIGDVKAIGDHTMWLDHGRIREIGVTDAVVARYLAAMVEKDSSYLETKKRAVNGAGGNQRATEIVDTIPNIDHRYGDRRAEVIGIALLDEFGTPIHLLQPSSKVVVRISVRANEEIDLPIVGFMMRNHLGIDFAGTNTSREGHDLPPMGKGDIFTVDFHLDIPELYPGYFSFSPAIADGTLHHYKNCDWIDNAITLQMGHSEGQIYGYLHLPCKVELNASLRKRPATAPVGSRPLAEFTGERVIAGQVDPDLFNEHISRYAFATRLARHKRVLDIACGTGYGSAELAAVARSVVGVDRALDAVEYAQNRYQAPNLIYEVASAEQLPYSDQSFDLITAFEVIEHLDEPNRLVSEAKRLLTPGGQFVVSTPNRLYYEETRRLSGPNPFHTREFEYEEFRAMLQECFPHVLLFVQNHSDTIVFQPCEAGTATEVRTMPGQVVPADGHFFVAVCAMMPQMGAPTFVYVPATANVLKEREAHIALLESELKQKNEWLDKATREHEALVVQHRAQTRELEARNQWAGQLNRDLEAAGLRVIELQEELAAEQKSGRETAASYESKIGALEDDLAARTKWAKDTEARLTADLKARVEELAKCVELLHQSEASLEERTKWALQLQKDLDDAQARLSSVQASRWYRMGRSLGLGPELRQS